MSEQAKAQEPWQVLDSPIAKNNKIRKEVFEKMFSFIKAHRPILEESKTYSTKRAYDFLHGVQLGLEIAKNNSITK